MRHRLNSTQVILLILIAIFTALNPNFLSPFNLYNFLMQNEYRLVMITGLAVIMLGGEIDLSLGYQISLVGILIGKLLTMELPVWICILAGIFAGCCCGLLNGFLIAGLNLSSVIVTLITQKLFQGISYLLSKGMTYAEFPEVITGISGMGRSVLSAGHVITFLSILFLEGLFCCTILGKNILSMGYDEQVLRQNGIPAERYKLIAYVIGSFFFSIAALLLISRQGLAVSNMGTGLEVDGMFAACIAGGASLILKNSEVKKRVPISNFYLGILVIAVIENGMQLSGSIQYYQYVITSAVVLYSVIPAVSEIFPKKQEIK
ncbi:MAG: ABC transporter permease [Candidatus Copromonas sp.]|nr:ABC transporter permease [Candidatus Copromonas sp.]